MQFTEPQASLFRLLGFRTFKTRADYSSDVLQPNEYVEIELRGGRLECHTMRGKYGCLAFVLPATASPATIVAQFVSLQDEATDDQKDLQWLLENDTDLYRQLMQVAETLMNQDLATLPVEDE